MATATFEEIEVKSVINRVIAPLLPFRWTINPYRGWQHACTYCFARNIHTYLGYDSGKDFNQRIVVQVNAPEVLRKRARPSPLEA
jgi:DNA repair photolyase